MIGTSLSHFKITAKLGEGGMGEVYRANDLDLGRPVALKVLPDEVAADPDRLERFKREARAIAALRHPHIVTIYSVEEADGIHFLTMELVEGESLDRLIPDGGFAQGRFFELAIQLSDALASAHDKGVIHRDLKPSNVMVDHEVGVKVLDFGLAKLVTAEDQEELSQLPTEVVTNEGVVLGTVPYMSPEQAEGRSVDHRSDIFSLGVVLYEMVTGVRPFQGDSTLSLMSAILRDEPASVCDRRDGLPFQLNRIIGQCLAKDPSRRFQAALDVRNQLEALKDEMSSQSAVAGTLVRPAERKRGLPIVATIVLTVVLAVGWWTTRSRPPASAVIAATDANIASLAVLPLTNLSGDPEQQYFADGMTEALITDLSKIGALKVISRTSSMRYRDGDRPLPEIAAELGVDGIIEGSVLKSGDRVRITAQLIHAVTDQNLWGESYERDLSDVLALQSEVARTVADAIEINLTEQEEDQLAEAQPVDPAAHEAYLKGRHSLNTLTLEGFERAEEFLEEAIAADPSYAPAYAALAEVYVAELFWGYLPHHEAIPLAEAALAKTLELDPSIANAYDQQAALRRYTWEWAEAEASFKRAIDLNPGLASARHLYGQLLSTLGRHDEAIENAKLAAELDPLSVDVGADLAFTYQVAGQLEEGEQVLRELLVLHPGALYVEWALGINLAWQGRYEEAIKTLLARDVRTAGQNFALGHIYGVAGRREEAQAVLDYLIAKSEERFVPPAQIASVLIGMGEYDRAFAWLDRAFDEGRWGLDMLPTMYFFAGIRDDPRYGDLLERINLAPD